MLVNANSCNANTVSVWTMSDDGKPHLVSKGVGFGVLHQLNPLMYPGGTNHNHKGSHPPAGGGGVSRQVVWQRTMPKIGQ